MRFDRIIKIGGLLAFSAFSALAGDGVYLAMDRGSFSSGDIGVQVTQFNNYQASSGLPSFFGGTLGKNGFMFSTGTMGSTHQATAFSTSSSISSGSPGVVAAQGPALLYLHNLTCDSVGQTFSGNYYIDPSVYIDISNANVWGNLAYANPGTPDLTQANLVTSTSATGDWSFSQNTNGSDLSLQLGQVDESNGYPYLPLRVSQIWTCHTDGSITVSGP